MLVRLFNVKQPFYFQETVMSVDKQIETEVVLANAAQMALSIVREVLGNEASDSVNGVEITDDVALSMISARLQSNMKIHLGEYQ